MKNTEKILNVNVSHEIAGSLETTGKILSASPDKVASMLLESIFHDKRAPVGSPFSSRRTFRKKINLPCVVKFSGNKNTVLYKSALLVDISITGVGVVVHDTTKTLETRYKNSESFELVLQIDDATTLNYQCKLYYWARDTLLRLGGELNFPDFSAYKKFLWLFMQATPSVAA